MELIVSYVVFVGYLIVLIFSIIMFLRFYLNNKEIKELKKYKYYRDIPGNYGPEILGYLLTGGYMKKEYLSASILELIRKKVFIIVENSNGSYRISDNDMNNLVSLSPSEKYLKDWLINDIGNGISFDTDDLYISYFDSVKRNNFELNFNEWSKIVVETGKKESFFLENYKIKYEILFLILGLTFFVFDIFIPVVNYGYLILISLLVFVFNSLAFLYVYKSNFKTVKGKEHYAKWMGFKNFISEFSNIDEKDILDVKLWDKYYVYATVFELTDKLDNTLLISDNFSVYDEDFFKKNIIGLKREILKINSEISDKKNLIQKLLYIFDKNRI